MPLPHNRSERMIRFSRDLRHNQTDAEERIWWLLRSNRLAGAKFRRQVPIGPYIVDFICLRRKLVVELDGGQHYTPEGRAKDARREDFLRSQGLRVLRFSDYDVLKDTEMVLTAIHRALEGPHP